jgi:RNA 2',3'-cyclic 3'-phosphodiesterase
MRLFVAIEVPGAWRAAAREATEALVRASKIRLRVVDPTLMHLTLRFLGEVPEASVEPLTRALNETVSAVDVELELGRAGTFGPAARTQVVWLSVGGDLDGLQALADRVEAAVRAAGLRSEERPLRPHLTLARLGRQLGPDDRRAVAEAARNLDPPPALAFRARELVLMRSHLGAAQPRYEVLARVPGNR